MRKLVPMFFSWLFAGSILLLCSCGNHLACKDASDDVQAARDLGDVGTRSFDPWVFHYEANKGQVTRLAIVRGHADRLKFVGYSGKTENIYYIEINDLDYLIPSSPALVLVDGRIKAMVTIQNVPPAVLTEFYRSLKSPPTLDDVSSKLMSLERRLHDQKASLLLGNMASEYSVDEKWKGEHAIESLYVRVRKE